MSNSRTGGICCCCGCPSVSRRFIAPACVDRGSKSPAPDDHFATCPDCGMIRSLTNAGCASCCPCVSRWIIASTCVDEDRRGIIVPTKHNHLTACPHRSMVLPRTRSASCVSGRPGVGCRIVSSTCADEESIKAAPDDHFISSLHYCGGESPTGTTNRICCCPGVSRWVISPASYETTGRII